MIDHKYIGFISNKVTYKDNDAIFNVITNKGKETFKARGILKMTSKNAASCNYFMISEFDTTSKVEKSNQTLKSASSIKIYKRCYEDILVSSCYLCICNLLDRFNNEINGFDIAIKCFDKLEEGVYPIDVVNYFLKNLTNGLGYKPNLNGCVNCGKKNNLISFSFESGGFVCKNCFDSQIHEHIPTNLLKEIYNFLVSDDLVSLSQLHSLKIFKMYSLFYKDVIGIDNKSFEFVLKCL